MVCECEIEITLTATSSVTLGNNFSMSVSVLPAGAKLDGYEFIIESQVGDRTLGSRVTPGSLTTMAKVPGNFMLKVFAWGKGNSYESNEVNLTVSYPSISQIMSQFGSAREHAWSKTLNAATSYTVREYGGRVSINTTGGSVTYPCTSVAGDPQTYDNIKNGINATINIPLGSDPPISDPLSGGTWTLGTFHAHPPFWNYPSAGDHDYVYRPIGFSPEDEANHNGFPGVVIDFIGINGQHTSRHSQSSPKTIYSYGPRGRER